MRRWLQERGWWRQGNDRDGLTHVFLDGGKACVPAAGVPEFLWEYAAAVAAGRPQFAVERIDPVAGFKFFMDLDMSEDDDAHCDVLGRGIARIVEGLTEASGLRVVWCKKRHASGPKRGLHLIWPDLVTDAATAASMCSEVVDRLAAAEDVELDRAALSKIVDCSVYRGTGLRMLCARKRDSPDVYVPVAESRDGSMADVPPGALAAVPDLAAWLTACCLQLTEGARHKLLAHPAAAGAGVVSRAGTAQAPARQPRGLAEFLPAVYQPCTLRVLVQDEDYAVLASSSRFCINVGREHHSNHVYFVACRHGVYQRCHCTSEGCDRLSQQLQGKHLYRIWKILSAPLPTAGGRPSSAVAAQCRRLGFVEAAGGGR